MTGTGGHNPTSAALEGTEAEDVVKPVRLLMASPIGRLGIEFRGTAVTRIVILPDRKEARLYQKLEDTDLTDFLLEAIGRLSEHMAGLRSNPELKIDLVPSELDTFTRRVFKETRRISYGRTWTYKRLAEACGRPDGYRVVQAALSQNPIPILIPCHRVVPSKGGVGVYIGGTKRKEKLLEIEQRPFG